MTGFPHSSAHGLGHRLDLAPPNSRSHRKEE
jgi:hypothetical protein